MNFLYNGIIFVSELLQAEVFRIKLQAQAEICDRFDKIVTVNELNELD